MEERENIDRWLVIVNVFAASRKAGSIWKTAAAMMEDEGLSYKVRFTGGKDNATELSSKACQKGYRKFVAVGGDGTVHDVLNGLASYAEENGVSLSEFTLAVLPVGSGNDWVKTFGVPKDIKAAVGLLKKGIVAHQDVVRVSLVDHNDCIVGCRYMANVGGVGLDARVCEIVNRKKEQGRRGKKLYISALAYCIRNRVPVSAKVLCDGKEVFSGKYLSIAFGIGKYSGGGMRQTPLALPDDGLLDVTIIPDISLWIIATKVLKLFTGGFHKVRQLTQVKCREVVIMPLSQADKEPVEVDGEVIGRAPVKMEILPQQLNIIIPDRR